MLSKNDLIFLGLACFFASLKTNVPLLDRAYLETTMWEERAASLKPCWIWTSSSRRFIFHFAFVPSWGQGENMLYTPETGDSWGHFLVTSGHVGAGKQLTCSSHYTAARAFFLTHLLVFFWVFYRFPGYLALLSADPFPNGAACSIWLAQHWTCRFGLQTFQHLGRRPFLCDVLPVLWISPPPGALVVAVYREFTFEMWHRMQHNGSARACGMPVLWVFQVGTNVAVILKFHWGAMTFYSSPHLLFCCVACFLFKSRGRSSS